MVPFLGNKPVSGPSTVSARNFSENGAIPTCNNARYNKRKS